jgi:branched-chain amino acid transport system ATP-binding protein
MSLLKIENLNKAFGSLVVTRGLSLDVAEGERHVIIGPTAPARRALSTRSAVSSFPIRDVS